MQPPSAYNDPAGQEGGVLVGGIIKLQIAAKRGGRHLLFRRVALASFVLGSVGLLFAACGGASGPGVASIGSSSPSTTTMAPTTNQNTGGNTGSAGGGGKTAVPGGQGSFTMAGVTVKFAECMQTHGDPNFPDPNGQGQVTMNGIDPNSSSFQAAQRVCAKYSPNKGQPPSPAQQTQILANALRFSECMRTHGITDFPDPTSSNGAIGIRISVRKGSKSDLNPHSPLFQTAMAACQHFRQPPRATGSTSKGPS